MLGDSYGRGMLGRYQTVLTYDKIIQGIFHPVLGSINITPGSFNLSLSYTFHLLFVVLSIYKASVGQ